MPDETRTPEAVAAEAWAIAKTPNMARDWGEERIAALIREEREKAFDAGLRTGRSRKLERLVSEAYRAEDSAKLHRGSPRDDLLEEAKRGRQEAGKLVTAARRLAVEGRSDGE